jgi:predicted RecA/RadA family phage recombinase
MKNYVQEGRVIALTSPAGGTVAGRGYLIGALFGIALSTSAAGQRTEFLVEGVVTHAKNATQAMAEGVALYWDNTAFQLTTTVGTNKLVGYCVTLGGQLAADTTVNVALVGL